MFDYVQGEISRWQRIQYLLNKYRSRYRPEEALVKAIKSGDIDAVRRWFRIDLEDLTLTELRAMAQDYGIYPVHGKNKNTLIWEIDDVRQSRRVPQRNQGDPSGSQR